MLHPFLTSVDDSAGEEGNMEEKLSEDYVPEIGSKVKEVNTLYYYLHYFILFSEIFHSFVL